MRQPATLWAGLGLLVACQVLLVIDVTQRGVAVLPPPPDTVVAAPQTPRPPHTESMSTPRLRAVVKIGVPSAMLSNRTGKLSVGRCMNRARIGAISNNGKPVVSQWAVILPQTTTPRPAPERHSCSNEPSS